MKEIGEHIVVAKFRPERDRGVKTLLEEFKKSSATQFFLREFKLPWFFSERLNEENDLVKLTLTLNRPDSTDEAAEIGFEELTNYLIGLLKDFCETVQYIRPN